MKRSSGPRQRRAPPPVRAIRIPVERELVHHPAAQVLKADEPPALASPWVHGVCRRQRLVLRQTTTPVGIAPRIPAIGIAFWQRGIATELVSQVASPTALVAL